MYINELKKADCKKLLSEADIPFDPRANLEALRELVRVKGLATANNDRQVKAVQDAEKADDEAQKEPDAPEKSKVSVQEGGKADPVLKGKIAIRGLDNHTCEMAKQVITLEAGKVIKVDAWKAQKLVGFGVAEYK